jgi:hypothetical protein
MSRNPLLARLGLAALALLGACTDNPMASAPEPDPVNVLSALVCRVEVQSQTMSCAPMVPTTGASLEKRIVGGQDLYVKLRSSGTSYDGTQVFQTSVTVQNLLGSPIGMVGGNPDSVNVFFASGPNVTGGSGNVAVANPDGTATFTQAGQEFFHYAGILEPYEISAAKTWQFNVDNTVTSFSFTVFVSAGVEDNAAPLLDAVWEGDVDTDWQAGGNWRGGAVPDSASVVSILADSLFAGPNMPVLSANASATHLRVGFGSTLGLGGFTMQLWGNLDATGAVSNGTVRLSGTNSLLSGTVNAVNVTGSYALQGATTATGAVSVADGTLTLNGNALTIQVP